MGLQGRMLRKHFQFVTKVHFWQRGPKTFTSSIYFSQQAKKLSVCRLFLLFISKRTIWNRQEDSPSKKGPHFLRKENMVESSSVGHEVVPRLDMRAQWDKAKWRIRYKNQGMFPYAFMLKKAEVWNSLSEETPLPPGIKKGPLRRERGVISSIQGAAAAASLLKTWNWFRYLFYRESLSVEDSRILGWSWLMIWLYKAKPLLRLPSSDAWGSLSCQK